MYSNFEPALKKDDKIVLGGKEHKVTFEDGYYWLHRDVPAHNLQMFFDAGLHNQDVEEFFKSVDPSIKPGGSWPCMTMQQLVRCVHAIRNDPRFNKSVNPVTEEEVRMQKTFTSKEELVGNVLKQDDYVVFNVHDITLKYGVRSDYLTCVDSDNARIFDALGVNKEQLARTAYGYDTGRYGVWPYAHCKDFAALTRLCIALYEEIERQSKPKVPDVLTSAAMVREFGLRNGTRILFPGTTTEYMVEGRPEMYSDGLYLNASEYLANDYIFTELKLDKYSFCSMLYGYGPKSGDWPEVDGADYAALTRVVVCLMELCELRESDKVKNLRAKLSELTAQRESYEEDVQAASKAVIEAEEALRKARNDLNYEKGELESLQEDIDELDEAIDEAIGGK
jgi:soluble cytochrome b562